MVAPRMTHWLILAIVLLTTTLLHGQWTNRWDETAGSTFSKLLLAQLPSRLGGWQGAEAREQPATAQQPYSCARHFRHARSEETVIVSLISGLPADVATHTPDVCYPGSGYTMKSAKQRETITLADGRVVQCWRADFAKDSATGTERLRVRWTWSMDGRWEAPDFPRLYYATRFADTSVLQKLYIVHPVQDETEHNSEYPEFIQQLFQQLNPLLGF